MTKVMVLSAMRGPKLNKYACGTHPIPYANNMKGTITGKIEKHNIYKNEKESKPNFKLPTFKFGCGNVNPKSVFCCFTF